MSEDEEFSEDLARIRDTLRRERSEAEADRKLAEIIERFEKRGLYRWVPRHTGGKDREGVRKVREL